MRHGKDDWSAKSISGRDVQRKLDDAKLPLSSCLSLPSFIKIQTRMLKEMVHCQISLMHSCSNF